MQWKDLKTVGAITNGSEAALNAFIKAQVGVADLRLLDPGRASQVIEALKSWLLRAAREKREGQST